MRYISTKPGLIFLASVARVAEGRTRSPTANVFLPIPVKRLKRMRKRKCFKGLPETERSATREANTEQLNRETAGELTASEFAVG